MLQAQRQSRTSKCAPVPTVCEVCRSQPVEAVVVEFNPDQDPHLLRPGMSVEPQVKCDDSYRILERQYQRLTNRNFQITKGENMTLETSLIDSALRNWRSNVDRAGKLFGNLSQEQLLQEIAPGKNRLIYLWGHLTAFNDALIPLLGFGARIHPELDLMFVSNPDRTVPAILLGEDLKLIWQETSEILWTSFTKLSIADWLQKHGAVSEEDFLREPHRNRFTVVLGRTAHIAYHLGQAKLWERVQT